MNLRVFFTRGNLKNIASIIIARKKKCESSKLISGNEIAPLPFSHGERRERSAVDDVESAVAGIAEVSREVGHVRVLRPQPLHDLARLDQTRKAFRKHLHL